MKTIATIGLLLCVVSTATNTRAQESPSTYLAEGDTFSFGSADFDTLAVTAERVSVEEIIRAITERLEADEARIRTHESTQLMTMIAHESQEPDCDDYTIYETAERQRVERGSAIQSVVLWERERKYRDGKLQEDKDQKDKKQDQEMKAEWFDIGQGLSIATPFDAETGDKYHYELEDRALVGNNVVYRIGFAPKNRFEALPSGTVWVDYTDLVLRRIEARYTDAVPVPLFLKAVPFLRITQKKVGDYWVADEIHARAVLRNLPIPDWPATLELRLVVKDHVINGTVRESDLEGSE